MNKQGNLKKIYKMVKIGWVLKILMDGLIEMISFICSLIMFLCQLYMQISHANLTLDKFCLFQNTQYT